MNKKKYCKVCCSIKKYYGLATIEDFQGKDVITNFQPIDKKTADSINNDGIASLPDVGNNLLACDVTGKRKPMCVDKSKKCNLKKDELRFQCLYCDKLKVERNINNSFEIYFLMDNSGSMSQRDRGEGAKAVKNLVSSLPDMDNTYYFVAWGSDAGYLFKDESDASKIEKALKSYVDGTCGYGGSTAAHKAFDLVKQDVSRAKRTPVIIFVTDGGFDDDKLALSARNSVLSANKAAAIISIGVEGADENNLRAVGTVSDFSKIAGDSSQLSKTFIDVAEFLRKSGRNA